jgi:hypothetical protein
MVYAVYSTPCGYQGILLCVPVTRIIYSQILVSKLLEAIGAISAAESKKATSRSGNYLDSATAPLGREHDDNAAGQDDADEQEPSLVEDTTGNILSGVDKVRGSDITSQQSLLTRCSSGKLSVRFVLAPSASRHG